MNTNKTMNTTMTTTTTTATSSTIIMVDEDDDHHIHTTTCHRLRRPRTKRTNTTTTTTRTRKQQQRNRRSRNYYYNGVDATYHRWILLLLLQAMVATAIILIVDSTGTGTSSFGNGGGVFRMMMGVAAVDATDTTTVTATVATVVTTDTIITDLHAFANSKCNDAKTTFVSHDKMIEKNKNNIPTDCEWLVDDDDPEWEEEEKEEEETWVGCTSSSHVSATKEEAKPTTPQLASRSIHQLCKLRGGSSVIGRSSSSSSSSSSSWTAASALSSSTYYGRRQQQRRRSTSLYGSSLPNPNQHYLDDPNWMTDPRVQPWKGAEGRRQRRRLGTVSSSSITDKLIAINIASFILQQIIPKYTSWGVKISDRILKGQELYRLITPAFLHGGLAHIGMNMYSLSNIGPLAEQMFGPTRFLTSYLVAGIAGNVLSAIMSPNNALGASGAIFGISGMLYVFLERNGWLFGPQGADIRDQVLRNVGINLVYGLTNPSIDNYGHIGGAIGGALMAYYFGPRLYLARRDEEQLVVVDKPLLKVPPVPKWIGSIPRKISGRFTRLTRRMQIWSVTDRLPSRPWRKPGADRLKRQQYKQRQLDTPNQSIKPKIDE